MEKRFHTLDEATKWLSSVGFPNFDNEMPTPDVNLDSVWNYSCRDFDGSLLKASLFDGRPGFVVVVY